MWRRGPGDAAVNEVKGRDVVDNDGFWGGLNSNCRVEHMQLTHKCLAKPPKFLC
jgi:hypothetical protein